MSPFNVGWTGLIVILIIALLVFGKRLPEVARSLGKGIVEFKKGLRGIEDEVDEAGRHSPPPPRREPDYSGAQNQSAETPSGTEPPPGPPRTED